MNSERLRGGPRRAVLLQMPERKLPEQGGGALLLRWVPQLASVSRASATRERRQGFDFARSEKRNTANGTKCRSEQRGPGLAKTSMKKLFGKVFAFNNSLLSRVLLFLRLSKVHEQVNV